MSDYITKRFQEKLDKWESKIQSKLGSIAYCEEYNKVNAELRDKQLYESMKNIIQEDMTSISYIETLNGNINFN